MKILLVEPGVVNTARKSVLTDENTFFDLSGTKRKTVPIAWVPALSHSKPLKFYFLYSSLYPLIHSLSFPFLMVELVDLVRVERWGMLFNKYRLIKIISYLIVPIRPWRTLSVLPLSTYSYYIERHFSNFYAQNSHLINLHKMQLLTQ